MDNNHFISLENLVFIVIIGLLSLLIYSILNNILMPKQHIAVVFDLDETLGSFVQFSVLKDIIEETEHRKLSQDEFNALLDHNIDFIRPGIIEILDYVVKKRKQKHCDSIMIYTNNQGPKEWVDAISNYFSYKIGENVFDQIIRAFKINGRLIEPCRTSHDKSYDDFIRCTKLPKNTQVCFFDDVEHPRMENDNVYYINVKPYDYKPKIDILLRNHYNKVSQRTHLSNSLTLANQYHPNVLQGKPRIQEEYELDIVIGKYMLQHIHEFFKIHEHNHTHNHNKTRKKHHKNQKQ